MERVVVVGGGVLGTMHAVSARRRGLDVLHIEREPEPRGASVRNFGLIWVSGRAPGPELSLALRARAGWEELAAEVPGTGFRPNGSLTLASDEAELRLLKEAARVIQPGGKLVVSDIEVHDRHDPIGRILTEEGTAFTRVPLLGPDRLHASVDGDTPPAPDGCPLARAYRVDVAGVPVMVIAEWFLSTLQSFEGERHQDVDRIRRQ